MSTPTGRTTQRVFVLAFAAVLLLMLIAAKLKGSGVDEFWSIVFADARLPWNVVWDAWAIDRGHPIGFYMLQWLIDPVVANDVFLRRATNLMFVGGLLVAGRSLARDGFFWLFAFVLLAQPYLIERFAEYRAAFGAAICVSIMLLGIRQQWYRDGTSAASWLPCLSLTAAMLLDYPIGLAGVAGCGAWMLVAIVERRREQALIAFAALAVGTFVIGLGTLNSSRFALVPAPYTQPMGNFWKDTAIMLAAAAASLCPSAAVALFAHRQNRWANLRPSDRQFIAILALTLIATVAGYFLINLMTAMMVRRQLIGLIPIVTMLLCAIVWPILREGGVRLVLLATIFPLILASSTVLWVSTKRGFDTFGPQLAAAQSACPTLRIYGVKPGDIDGTVYHNPYPGIADPVAVGLPITARSHGFRLAESPRRVDGACGAIIWSEFFWGPAPSASQIAERAGLGASAEALASSRILYTGHSFVMIVPGANGRLAMAAR